MYNLYINHAQCATAIKLIVVWSSFLLVSSRLTKTTGDDEVSVCNGSLASFLELYSTWYLQQGSNCQDTPYNPAQKKLTQPIGQQM